MGAAVGAMLGVLAAITVIVTTVVVIVVLRRRNSFASNDSAVANPIYEGMYVIRFIEWVYIYIATLKSPRRKGWIYTRNGQERGGSL